ncbi:GNAT family N-acetyltransferase [Plectonema cf. radiosum LEGE 06105]|uniref:GNAT family N-acetyltransferase n=1 Tax=Plectonema cf. radiosum LEGE 06105 TaxID=945769 RepID=A0A8J7K3F3_9CYAN|nr:GNAT family N-acetyltransferase [Plectonema radiosum]MBE9214077.1 GNAT family N-acetyltransferase [Plectonema cf. radiosum LEGE 06105]
MNTQIICLEKTQINQAAETLVTAFDKDPIFEYLTSHTNNTKYQISRNVWDATLRYAQPYNYIYTTPEIKGIAAWIPPGNYPLNVWRLLRVGFYKLPFLVGFEGLKRFISLFSLIEKYHEQDMHQPHWYLSALGVSEIYQGQGIGSLLIQPILKLADEQGLPCYLETSTEKAVRFYKNNGFEIIRTGKEPIEYWTMKREPSNQKE